MPPFKVLVRRLFGFDDPFFLPRGPLPPVKYNGCRDAEQPPAHGTIGEDELHIVSRDGRKKWMLLRCPCGCGDVITLSLQTVHRPHWSIHEKNGRPYLFPSVWRDVGCYSHFWIKDGRVFWVGDSGTSPEHRRVR